MKVSKEKRAEIRRSLVAAAVELFSEQRTAEASMREVAARAGVAPATAYKYFPSRAQLYHAYFELKAEDAEALVLRIEGFEAFELKEKLQAYLETLLAELLPDREFVSLAMHGLIDAPLLAFSALQPAKRRVIALVESFLTEAIEAGQVPEGAHHGVWVSLFWDYTMVLVLYWLRDDSESFAKTSELIDTSLDVYVTLIQSGFVDKAARVVSFLVKSHFYGDFARLSALFAPLGVPLPVPTKGAAEAEPS